MRKFAADNLMFLREQYPQIYEFVRNKESDASVYQKEFAKNGQGNLRIQRESGEVFHLYSKYNPELEAARWAESLEDQIKDSKDVLIIGFGLGYHVKAFLDAYPDKRVYVYEPNIHILLTAIETADLRETLSNRRVSLFAVGDDDQIIFNMLIRVYNSVRSDFTFIAVPPYRRLYPELEARMAKHIAKAIRSYGSDIYTVSHFKQEWIENTIINMERNLRTPSFVPLRGICQGIPAIIVGSGPSLDMEAEFLRKLKKQALIIAAGTSIMGLLHHGIEPHLIISMDPGKFNERAYARLNISDIPFLYISTIKHTAISNDRSAYLMHGFYNTDVISKTIMDLTDQDGVFAATSSVSGTAVQMAVFLGCTEIIFVGQDFSYPENQPYSEGVKHITERWIQNTLKKSNLQVRNVKGGYNAATQVMLNLKRDFEDVLRVFPGIQFYNASQVGAEIEGTISKSLQELFDPEAADKIPEDWFKTQMRLRLKPYPPERKQKVQSRITHSLQGLEQLEHSLDMLSKHLSRNDYRADWFIAFEKIWSSIVQQEIYREWFTYFLVAENVYAQRYWAEIAEEIDLKAKREKLDRCVMPIFQGMQKLVPLLIQQLKRLQANLAAKE